MKLHPREFVRFIDGRLPSPTIIAALPGHLGGLICCVTTDVQIARNYAVKVLMKHKLRYEHSSNVQKSIDRGWCVQVKANHIEFYFEDDEVFGGWFILVVKAAKSGSECWVVTFFRSNLLHIRSKLRRARLGNAVVRYHDGSAELLEWWGERCPALTS
jgi:hypothetical protein